MICRNYEDALSCARANAQYFQRSYVIFIDQASNFHVERAGIAPQDRGCWVRHIDYRGIEADYLHPATKGDSDG